MIELQQMIGINLLDPDGPPVDMGRDRLIWHVNGKKRVIALCERKAGAYVTFHKTKLPQEILAEVLRMLADRDAEMTGQPATEFMDREWGISGGDKREHERIEQCIRSARLGPSDGEKGVSDGYDTVAGKSASSESDGKGSGEAGRGYA